VRSERAKFVRIRVHWTRAPSCPRLHGRKILCSCLSPYDGETCSTKMKFQICSLHLGGRGHLTNSGRSDDNNCLSLARREVCIVRGLCFTRGDTAAALQVTSLNSRKEHGERCQPL
jgi:hypothetical protein